MDELLEAWEQSYGGWAEDLMDDGYEGLLLKPLAGHPDAALALIEHVKCWNNHKQRKIAATIAGYLGPKAPGSLLDELFEAERNRDAATDDMFERLNVQSVVEDVVFAATRWCRHNETRSQGIAILKRVVEDTLSGTYWNTASYAMATLLFHGAPGSELLLSGFAAFASGKSPDHPSRPSLDQEREFASKLIEGDKGCIASIETHLANGEVETERFSDDPGTRDSVDEFLTMAAAFAPNSRP